MFWQQISIICFVRITGKKAIVSYTALTDWFS